MSVVANAGTAALSQQEKSNSADVQRGSARIISFIYTVSS
jgi:hypothetical protein